ncbi:hypothetical protein MKW94_002694 [Papaver nudicaule]|uniref:Uncharacterized protein n=1 Tax=Papaver nudicaule TaxID=74823 RepID=A0AA41VXE1_PAPNU|nr:hypothetical protein [Papaver nudicaule]
MGSQLSSFGKTLDIGFRIASRINSHFPHTSRLYYHPPNPPSLKRQKDALSAAAGGSNNSSSSNSGCGCGNNKAFGVGGAADYTECIIHIILING